MILHSIKTTLNELSQLLGQLSSEDYCRPCEGLSNATIGEHSRHIIEMFQCLHQHYESGIINYDQRNRDFMIQTNTAVAISSINTIIDNLEKPNKTLHLHQKYDGEQLSIETNYDRELLYNLEHCIHHQALIKVAIIQSNSVSLDKNFGVARSTIEYRKQCAQ